MAGKTLSQLTTSTYNLIGETEGGDTHFPDNTVIHGFLNEGAEFLAVFIEYPRDIVSVQVEAGKGEYSNPEDNLLIRTAYFGDETSNGSNKIAPIKVVSEETLASIYPNWLSQHSADRADRPEYLIQKDRLTIHVYPVPNATGAAGGNKLFLNYNYVPAVMTAGGNTPDLPIPYHNLLPLYAAHLAYLSDKLNDKEKSANFYASFWEKVTRLKSAVTKESKELQGFSWGYSDIDVGDGFGGGVLP
jgi:hypothetical protein